jgi:hypothetical protein
MPNPFRVESTFYIDNPGLSLALQPWARISERLRRFVSKTALLPSSATMMRNMVQRFASILFTSFPGRLGREGTELQGQRPEER